MPTSTIEARESKIRRPSVGEDSAIGVTTRDRGDDRALDGGESSSRIVANARFVPSVAAGIAVGCLGVFPL
jgi:hypothetical protein